VHAIPRQVADDMRVPDYILKSVCLVAEEISQDLSADTVDELGTGFVVGVRSKVAPSFPFFYLVTAKHVVKEFIDQKRPLVFAVNSKTGNLARLPTISNTRWRFHPTDNGADVAVLPLDWIGTEFDFLTIHSDLLANPQVMKQFGIGIGDDVYLPGLFGSIAGFKRFHPIVRHGMLAMLPIEQIEVDGASTDVYLIEARSIGGISGSPVFVRPTVSYRPNRNAQWLDGLARFHRVIGMVRGHWDIRESERNNVRAQHSQKYGVNMGIASITPAFKIIETLNHPDFLSDRESFDAKVRANISCTLDRRILKSFGKPYNVGDGPE
jgi:hypothetical protein